MSEWRPIETAPKDGSWVLAIIAGYYSDDQHYIPAVVQWNGHFWTATGAGEEDPDLEGRWSGALTHWMPLPAPPGEGSQAPAQSDGEAQRSEATEHNELGGIK